MTDDLRLAQLRGAYARGRLGLGLRNAALAGLVAAALWSVGVDLWWTLGLSAGLAVALLAAGWFRTSMLKGARLGLLGVVPPVLAVAFMGSCSPYVTDVACMQVCLSLSIGGGLLLGAAGGVMAARTHAVPFFGGLATTAILAGCGCCVATGVGEALGLGVALVVAAMPAYAVRRWAFAGAS